MTMFNQTKKRGERRSEERRKNKTKDQIIDLTYDEARSNGGCKDTGYEQIWPLMTNGIAEGGVGNGGARDRNTRQEIGARVFTM